MVQVCASLALLMYIEEADNSTCNGERAGHQVQARMLDVDTFLVAPSFRVARRVQRVDGVSGVHDVRCVLCVVCCHCIRAGLECSSLRCGDHSPTRLRC